MWEPFDARVLSTGAWHMVQSLLLSVTRQPALRFDTAVGTSLPLTVERLTGVFSCAVQFSRLLRQDRTACASLR